MRNSSFQRYNHAMMRCFYSACLLAAMFAGTPAQAQSRWEITILADAALIAPLTEISREYARTNDAIISVVLNTSGSATDRIRGGLPVDVVLTASASTRNSLNLSGQVDQSASIAFANDPLALVTARASNRITSEKAFSNLLRGVQNPTLVLIDAEGNPALAEAAAYGTSNAFDPKPQIVLTPDIKTALHELKAQGSFGLLPRSVAQTTPGISIQSIITQDKKTQGTIYYADVLASEHMAAARLFTQFLLSDPVQNILARHGFIKP